MNMECHEMFWMLGCVHGPCLKKIIIIMLEKFKSYGILLIIDKVHGS